MDENFECYYCRMATEDLQKCADRGTLGQSSEIKNYNIILNENTGKHGMMKKTFGFIPNNEMLPGQKAIVNREDWTVTTCDTNERHRRDGYGR